jgi:hypothetical protein
MERLLAEAQQQLAEARCKEASARDNEVETRQKLAHAESRLLRCPLTLETELYELIYAAVSAISERNGDTSVLTIPTLEEVLAVRSSKVPRFSIENGKRKRTEVNVNPGAEIRRVCTELYEYFYSHWNEPGIWRGLVDPNQRRYQYQQFSGMKGAR